MSKRIVIDVDRDGWTKNLQLNIANIDENNRGMGYRLAGPKYNGSSTNLLRAELDDRDAGEIRDALDEVFPQQPAGPALDALRTIHADMVNARSGGDEWASEWLGELWTTLPLEVRAAAGDTDAAEELADAAALARVKDAAATLHKVREGGAL